VEKLNDLPQSISNLFPKSFGAYKQIELSNGNFLWLKRDRLSKEYCYHLLRRGEKNSETFFGPRCAKTPDEIDTDWAMYGESQAARTFSDEKKKE
jgi:hypothetical protein